MSGKFKMENSRFSNLKQILDERYFNFSCQNRFDDLLLIHNQIQAKFYREALLFTFFSDHSRVLHNQFKAIEHKTHGDKINPITSPASSQNDDKTLVETNKINSHLPWFRCILKRVISKWYYVYNTMLILMVLKLMIAITAMMMVPQQYFLAAEKESLKNLALGCTEVYDESETTLGPLDKSLNYCKITPESSRYLFKKRFGGLCLYHNRIPHIDDPFFSIIFIELSGASAPMMDEIMGSFWISFNILLVLGFLLSIFKLYALVDFSQILFILEPKFIAFRVRRNIKIYLEMLRISYVNFWSIYGLDTKSNHLIALELICQNCKTSSSDQSSYHHHGRNNSKIFESHENKFHELNVLGQYHHDVDDINRKRRFSRSSVVQQIEATPDQYYTHQTNQHSNIVDCFALNRGYFDRYIPESRKNKWQIYLTRLHPVIFWLMFGILGSAFVIVQRWMVDSLNRIPKLNKELIHVLTATLDYPNEPREMLEILADRCPTQMIIDFRQPEVTQSLANFTNDYITEFIGSTKFTNYLSSSAIKYYDTLLRLLQKITNEEQIYNGSIVQMIQPFDQYNYWGSYVPVMILLTVASLASFGFAIATTVIMDLCFWLAELTIKIQVCTLLLRHYQEFDDKIPTSSSSSSLHLSSKYNNNDKDEFNDTETNDRLCHIDTPDIIRYGLAANQRQRQLICERYANKVLESDRASMTIARIASHRFLVSTYIDYRLFVNEIELSRSIMVNTVCLLICHTLNIICTFLMLRNSYVKNCLLIGATFLNNVTIFAGSWFSSQCLTLNSIIYSMIASSIKGDKLTRFMMMIWKKTLTDLTGSNSKFVFKFLSINLSYALAIQLDLTIASIFIITLQT